MVIAVARQRRQRAAAAAAEFSVRPHSSAVQTFTWFIYTRCSAGYFISFARTYCGEKYSIKYTVPQVENL